MQKIYIQVFSQLPDVWPYDPEQEILEPVMEIVRELETLKGVNND